MRCTKQNTNQRGGFILRKLRSRRGIVSVLAMMFMVLFGSLAAAMAIVSKGNLRTARTYLRVTGALGAVDAGMGLAEGRLARAAAQLRVWKGSMDAAYAEKLWNGTFTEADGIVLNAAGQPTSQGLRDVLAAMHPAQGDNGTIDIDPEYTAQSDWLVTATIALEYVNDQPVSAFQITYIPVPLTDQNQLGVRAVVTGYSWDYVSSRWTKRSAQQMYVVSKYPQQAVLGPSKIMIGKNVQINGPLGALFTGVQYVGGHPLVVKSDFYSLDPILDQKLDDFYAAVLATDSNGDNRLSTLKYGEQSQLSTLESTQYDDGQGGQNSNMVGDYTGDGLVDEYDIFLKHYDSNSDGRVALSDTLRYGTPNQQLTAEFSNIDEDLGMLIDNAVPDRNGDDEVDFKDTALGYHDGVLDSRDRYAKIRGHVLFRTQREPWELQTNEFGVQVGNYQKLVKGVIIQGKGDPVVFGAGPELLPDISSNSFDTAQTELGLIADGPAFNTQANVSWVWQPTVDTNGVVTGQTLNPDFLNAPQGADIGVVIEPTPFSAATPADYYQRPVFRNKNFKNVIIPEGLNALFINCTFAGVTRIQTSAINTHASWQLYGSQNADLSLAYPPLPAASDAMLDNDYYPADGSIIPPLGFDVPRLLVNGTPYVNTKPLSNNIRFESCIFVGSIVADRPVNYTNIRNKLEFTGSTKFVTKHPTSPNNPALNPDPEDLGAISKSSMMLPHYSVDIGENNASPNQDVTLNGVIIAGVLDVRGNATINGALLMTFEPMPSDPALQHYGQVVGNPADFNVTLGYFGTDQGDKEGLAPFLYNNQLIVGFDTNNDGRTDTINPADGGTPVPFNGYSRLVLNFNPKLVMPDGLISPLQIIRMPHTYHEGRVIVEVAP